MNSHETWVWVLYILGAVMILLAKIKVFDRTNDATPVFLLWIGCALLGAGVHTAGAKGGPLGLWFDQAIGFIVVPIFLVYSIVLGFGYAKTAWSDEDDVTVWLAGEGFARSAKRRKAERLEETAARRRDSATQKRATHATLVAATPAADPAAITRADTAATAAEKLAEDAEETAAEACEAVETIVERKGQWDVALTLTLLCLIAATVFVAIVRHTPATVSSWIGFQDYSAIEQVVAEAKEIDGFKTAKNKLSAEESPFRLTLYPEDLLPADLDTFKTLFNDKVLKSEGLAVKEFKNIRFIQREDGKVDIVAYIEFDSLDPVKPAPTADTRWVEADEPNANEFVKNHLLQLIRTMKYRLSNSGPKATATGT